MGHIVSQQSSDLELAKLLEEENNNLRDEINALKSPSTSSTTTDEGHSFLEAENARLREELESLKKINLHLLPQKKIKPARGTTNEARTQQTLTNQAAELKAKK